MLRDRAHDLLSWLLEEFEEPYDASAIRGAYRNIIPGRDSVARATSHSAFISKLRVPA
jgi:hypothetical protein